MSKSEEEGIDGFPEVEYDYDGEREFIDSIQEGVSYDREND
jgi:hypothetical protein